jgi:hypothetical protein
MQAKQARHEMAVFINITLFGLVQLLGIGGEPIAVCDCMPSAKLSS